MRDALFIGDAGTDGTPPGLIRDGTYGRACGMMRIDHSHGSLGHLACIRKRLGPARSFGRTIDAGKT